jgi:hypothetical protein
MPGTAPHIPYARFRAALEACDLAFILRNAERLTFSLADAVEVCLLICAQAPERLEPARLRWVRRYAAEADRQQWGDYRLIVDAFDALPSNPEQAVGRLLSLCATRGLGRAGG